MQNLTKIIQFGGADPTAFFHAVDGRTADPVLVNERIGRLPARLERSPKRCIAYHGNIIKSCHILDNSHIYDYNIGSSNSFHSGKGEKIL